MEIELRLRSDVFLSLLEGKKLCYKTSDYNITIIPPHYGLYFTIPQIVEIKQAAMADGAYQVLKLLETKNGDK